jgi:hypothetical protein
MLSFFTNRESYYKKANFEDVQYAIRNQNKIILMNTLSTIEQNCLIVGTIDAFLEENIVNEMMNSIHIPDKPIIIYGKHVNDETPTKKYKQLQNLGITNIMIYSGGLFEWMLLQDIYGSKEFPTTSKMIDILKYKPERNL